MPDTPWSAQDFIEKMDRDLLNGRLNRELRKLTHEQAWEVAQILMERSKRKIEASQAASAKALRARNE